jgi:hypothetical protein
MYTRVQTPPYRKMSDCCISYLELREPKCVIAIAFLIRFEYIMTKKVKQKVKLSV